MAAVSRYVAAYLSWICAGCANAFLRLQNLKSKPAPRVLTLEHAHKSTNDQLHDSGYSSASSANTTLSEQKKSYEHLLARRDTFSKTSRKTRTRYVRQNKYLLWGMCSFRARPYLREGSNKWKDIPVFYEEGDGLDDQPMLCIFRIDHGRALPTDFDQREVWRESDESDESSESDDDSESSNESDAESDYIPSEEDARVL